MSTSSTKAYTELDIAIVKAFQVDDFINVALLSVAIYDRIITFDEEMRLVWCYGLRGKNFGAASILFLANRYLSISYGIIGFLSSKVSPTTTCVAMTRLIEGIILGIMLCFAVFSAYRVYALQVWKHSLLGPAVLLLNLTPFVINLYTFVRYKPAITGPPFSPCGMIDPLSPFLEAQFVYTCRLSVIAADAIVLASTLTKTVPEWIEARKLIAVPLSTAIIQDGSAYFFILLVMNIFQMVTFSVWKIQYLTAFIYVLTPILSCHLMLNLRRINDQPGSPKLNSHILRQLQSQCDVNVNQIIDSPSGLTGLDHMQDIQRTTPSSNFSSEQGDRFSQEHEHDIQEVQRRV